MAARTRLLLEKTDAFLTTLPSPVNRGKRALFPVVVQRNQLADALLKQLQAIGLERRAKPVQRLSTLIAQEQEQQP